MKVETRRRPTCRQEQLVHAASLAAFLAAAVLGTAAAQEKPPGSAPPTAAPPVESPSDALPPQVTPEIPPTQQGAQASPPADALQALKERLDAQAHELEQLRKNLETSKAAAEARPAPPPPPTVFSRVPGLSLGGFVQMDYVSRQSSVDQLDPSTGEPLNEDRFMLRRARLRAQLERAWVAGAVELDGNTVKGAQARVVGAESTFRVPPHEDGITPLSLTGGLFKIPFGFEVVQSDRDRFFVERSAMSRGLFPGEYDLGARVAGGWKFLRWAAALQNGNPAGDKAFALRDPNATKDLSLRGGVDVTAGRVRVWGGASYLEGKGFHRGNPATKDTFQWRDFNENGVIDPGEIQVVPGRPATPSSDFDRSALGADARVMVVWPRLGATELGAEVMVATNLDRGLVPADPISSGRDLREAGWYLAATQELGPFLQVGVRYDTYDPDRDATDARLGKVVPADAGYSTLALALAVRAPGGGRIVAEWDRNRNHLGRDAAGVPTNLKDDAVVVRAEVTF